MACVLLNIMLQPNQMDAYRYERIPCCIHVRRIPVAFIRIIQIYLRQSVLTVNPIKMLLLAMKQCMISFDVTTVVQMNRIQ